MDSCKTTNSNCWASIPLVLAFLIYISFTCCNPIPAINKQFGISPNNPVEIALEEVVDDVVKIETGIDLDLVPNKK